jgi:hypothetical protein
MPKKIKVKPSSTRVLDYPETLSQYERESLAAEAILKAEREAEKKTPRARKT